MLLFCLTARHQPRRVQFHRRLFAPPFRKVTGPMKKGSDDDPVFADPVEQSVFVHEQFPNRFIADLWHDVAAFSQG